MSLVIHQVSMDRRRHEDSRERQYSRRRDDYEDEYRGRSRYDRVDRARNRSRSRSTSRDRSRIPRSRSPRRDYDDRRSHKYSHDRNNRSNYRDLDRPEESRDNKKEAEIRKSLGKEPIKPILMSMATEPVAPSETEEQLDEDAQLAAFLGITSFASTKGQKVAGNAANAAVDASTHKKKKREYRQYLFVKGAYDIPLTKDQLEAKEKEMQVKKQMQQQ